MQRIFLVWFSLCCILFAARAEHEGVNLNPSDANIFGHVVDKKSGEHISYVNIFLEGTTIGTVTDAAGHYSLTNLPEGEFSAGAEIDRVSDGQEEGGSQERENLGGEF